MNSYRLIGKLDRSKDSNKDMAVKYDAGKIKSEKYGEASLSGHFLFINRQGEFPPVYTKQIEEQAYKWWHEMRLEGHQDDIFKKTNIPSIIALTAPGIDSKKLEHYFKMVVFGFLLDNNFSKLNNLNRNDPVKQLEDVAKSAESLISIINSHGDDLTTEAAVAKLNPIFKTTCMALSNLCSYSFQRMNKDNYKHFARELVDFIRVNKWLLEYHNSSFSEKDYFFVRPTDAGIGIMVESLIFVKDIHISDEVRMHPLYRKYLENAGMHIAFVNDILSLHKETANNEKENVVLFKCEKHSLQKSIRKTEKAANELITELKKDGIRLKSYFPSDYNMKNFVETVESLVDGFIYWHQVAPRYGSIKYEKYEVEYDCNYKSLLEKVRTMNGGNLKEPVFLIECK